MSSAETHRCWKMDKKEILSPDIPPLLLAGGEHFEEMYRTSLLVHQEHLGNGGEPVLSNNFLQTLAERLQMLPHRGPSITVFGGGNIPGGREGLEYTHGFQAAGYVAGKFKDLTVNTGSGPMLMEAPHLGASAVLNGRARNNGVTMEGLIKMETPGDHNERLAVVRYMPRRLEQLLRLGMAAINHPGGAGSLQEWGVQGAILADPRNQGLHYPVIFSEPYTGDQTPMRRVMRLFDAIAGPGFAARNIVSQQGDDFSSLDVLDDLREDPHGFWNGAINLHEQAFVPFQMTPEFISSIDLSAPQDDPVRAFSALSQLAFYIVQTFLYPRCARFHGRAQIRISRSLYGPLKEVLDGFWAEQRIKSAFKLEEIIDFQLVQ